MALKLTYNVSYKQPMKWVVCLTLREIFELTLKQLKKFSIQNLKQVLQKTPTKLKFKKNQKLLTF